LSISGAQIRSFGERSESLGSPRRSKADQIHLALKQAIISGELTPGATIDKSELCERFGVSRLPVSTAVNRLAYEGLALVEPQRGSYVAPIQISDVRQWMAARRALEAELAREAAARLPDNVVRDLERSLRYLSAAIEEDDVPGFLRIDIEFHSLLVDGLGAQRIGELLESLRSHIDRVRRLLLPEPGTMEATLAEHRAIVEAIRARDPARAAEAMRSHLDTVLTRLVNYEARRPNFFET